ncbi:hypothetical protein B5C34_13440 [Pacificimonas flava]|uniref:AttH domain-containing protein n=2 Tax=Pacificimonas TaxID=1960290 RepID=A0A219B7I8_9SPHN|nr:MULTISPECIES: hypothetical protein [Pacificimonas]MBZ6379827.1 hypothetical protein [Pacificimonas aurantium]OWV34362.1 hypothetical protein B5C34_13440 [Pacificimonas flava]
MAALPVGLTYKLAPEDEYPHDPGAAENYNESMYLNAFDPETRLGAWFRIGNRPNQGYAEMTVCLYLPEGRVGFMFARPSISSNDALDAGGLSIAVEEPFKRLKVSFEGEILILDRPEEMARPKEAFRDNPRVPCRVSLTYSGVSPMYGGEAVREDGSEIEIDPEKSFAKAHYEQHCTVAGTVEVDGETHEFDGYGLRDKSWGPRHWQAISWYRWCPMNFSPDFGMMFTVMGDGEGGARASGMVFREGVYDDVTACELDSDWDADDYQTALRATVRTAAGKSYEVSGKVLSLIPLRNRRTTPDGEELMTRITEAMTEYRCEGMTGFGMSEYLDQIVDGKAIGRAAGY